MKKLVLSIIILSLSVSISYAQSKKRHKHHKNCKHKKQIIMKWKDGKRDADYIKYKNEEPE